MVETTQWVEYVQGHDQTMWGQENAYPENVQILVAPQMHPQPELMHRMPTVSGPPAVPMDVKQRTTGPADRTVRRKQATQREKRRMEKLNHCIEDIRAMVCPNMKTPTKAKILREAINRIQYLEQITAELMEKKGDKVQFPNSQPPAPIVQPPQTQQTQQHHQQPQHVIIAQAFNACASPEATMAYSPEMVQSYSPDGRPAYSPDTVPSYSPEPAALPAVEVLQNLSDESNSTSFDQNSNQFDTNGEFYLQVQHEQPDGIQLFDEASYDGHAYYHDAPISYKYE